MDIRHAFFMAMAFPVVALLNGCGSVKIENLTMLDTVGTEQDSIEMFPVLRIKEDDILSIQVSSRRPEDVLAFQQFRREPIMASAGASALGVQEGYRVDEEGNIYLPYLGKVVAKGKTLVVLRQEITSRLMEFIQDAAVQVRFMNFRVTLLGEVKLPNTYIIPNERLTILEAIGMAGDFTSYAKRNDVLVIRERGESREFARVNTQDKDVFTSRYFYLSPNDIVYIEPLKAKQYATQGDFFQRYAGVLVPFVSLVTFFIGTTLK